MIRNITISIVIVSVAAFSTYTAWNTSGITPDEYLSIANSVIGVLGALLLLGRMSFGNFLFFIWIFLQLAVVDLGSELKINLESVGVGVVSLSQLNFVQYFFYSVDGASLNLGDQVIQINLVPFAYFLLFFIPNTSSSGTESKSIGKVKAKSVNAGGNFELRLFRWNKHMERIVPQQVQVLKKVDFKDNKNWYLVRLSKPVKVKGGQFIKNALIKPKDDNQFFKNLPGQMGYFRLLKSETDLDLRKSRFIDWVLVR